MDGRTGTGGFRWGPSGVPSVLGFLVSCGMANFTTCGGLPSNALENGRVVIQSRVELTKRGCMSST